MRNEKGQKSKLICELASRTHDAERAARVARGCREEQDDAIDDPGDVEDDNRHDGEEQAKSQDIFFDLHIGQPSPDGKQSRADKGEDQEQKKAVKEQPDWHLLVTSPLHEGGDEGEEHQEAAEQHDCLEDKGRVVYLWVFHLYLSLSQTYFSTDLNNIQSRGVWPNRQKPQF